VNVLSLSGLRADPVQSYLVALGVVRCVAEQADPAASLAYHPSGFRLHTTLDLDGVITFFTERWKPTPVVSPWNKGSGLRPDGSAASAIAALDRLRAGSDARLDPLRVAVAAAEEVIDSFPPGANLEQHKAELLRRCRARLPDEALDWFDASVVLLGDDPVYPRLLGTGGNLGRMDLSANFYERLDDVVGLAAPADHERAVGWLQDLLAGTGSTPRTRATPGQYEPGAVGGVNSVSDDRDAASVNPWGFVLALEGALLFAALPARRLGAASATAAMPFTVRSDAAGSAGLATEETRFAELWLPLWERPASLAQLRRLFGEGRLTWGQTTATSTVDAARAIASFGTERGITAFQRYAIVERLGQSPLVVPVERYATASARRPALESTRALDAWVGRLRGAERAPSGVDAALRTYDTALLRLAAGQRGAVLLTLTGLAVLDRMVQRNTALREELRPLPWIDPATWLPDLVEEVGECVELDLAVAAASAWDRDVPPALQTRPGTWPRSVGVALRGLAPASLDARGTPAWSSRADAGASPGDGVSALADIHVRHAAGLTRRRGDRIDGAEPAGTRPTMYALGRWTTPIASRALVSGRVDEALFDRLLRCLCLLDPRGDWAGAVAPTSHAAEPPPDQAGLALHWLLVQQGRDPLDVPMLSEERHRTILLTPAPEWPALLRRGRIDRVLSEARRRLHVAGLPALEPPDAPTGPAVGDRLAAALLLPISGTASAALLRRLLDPTRIPVRSIRRHTTIEGDAHAQA
jgi:CRISPR-associated protein Csx17